MKKHIQIFALLMLLLLLTESVSPQGLPTATPDEMGLSSTRLSRIKPFMQSYVDQGKLPGLITMIARHGKVVHFEKYGAMDVNKPMQFDTIFRIASMTKPITSVAIMMLYEEGKFLLNDPVSKFIPDFEDVKVFSHIDQNGLQLVEQQNPITIQNLLTHTSGLTYGFFGNTPVDSMYREAALFNGTLEEMVQKVTKLPLLYQPGTKWNYGVSTDVLGYLIEVLSGKPFNEFLQQRIFKPLGMKDTDFYVPQGKINRFAALYKLTNDGTVQVSDKPETGSFLKYPTLCSGGGGLVSTASDYMRFAQMLLNKGEIEGIRLLGRKTVEFMTRNQLANELLPIHPGLLGQGFGLGFAVLVSIPQSFSIGSEGEFEWRGIYNTFFWVDPNEDMILVLMTQFSPYLYYPIYKEFKVLTYQAIVD